jgi:hypothetical protein
MPAPVKGLLLGAACFAAIIFCGGLLAQFVWGPMVRHEIDSSWGMVVYIALALALLCAPSFLAGFVSKKWGALLGFTFGAATIALLNIVWSNTPLVVFAVLAAVAMGAGHAGQLPGRRVRA